MNKFCKNNRHLFIPPWWKKNRVCLLCGTIDNFKTGQHSITLSPPGGGDVIRWSTGESPTRSGDLGMDIVTGRMLEYVDGSVRPIAHTDEIAGAGTIQLIAAAGGITVYSTIALAIVAAVSGDRIVLGPGTYTDPYFLIPAGVTLEGADKNQVIIEGSAATGDRVGLSDGSRIKNVTVLAPTDNTVAIKGPLVFGQVGYIEDVYIKGPGSGVGIGMLEQDNRGPGGTLIIKNTHRISGMLGTFLLIRSGYTVLDNVSDMSTSDNMLIFFYISGSTSNVIFNNIRISNPGITQVIYYTGSTVTMNNVYLAGDTTFYFTKEPQITINGGTIGGVTPIAFSGSFPSGDFILNDVRINSREFIDLEDNFTNVSGIVADNDSEFRHTGILDHCSVGSVLRGREFSAGHSTVNNEGLMVLTTDNTAGLVSDGANFVDATANALYFDASVVEFQGNDVNYSILFGTSILDVNLSVIKHFGLEYLLNQTDSGDGEYVFEIWTGAAWTPIQYCLIGTDSNYRYAKTPFIREQSEQAHYNVDNITGWVDKSINGTTAYWSRVRILTAPTTLPQFSRIKLLPSSIQFDQNGFCRMYGLSKYTFSVLGVSNVFAGSDPFGVADVAVPVGSGGGATGWTHAMTASSLEGDGYYVDAGFTIPKGTCTAMPMYCTLYYTLDGVQPVTVDPSVIISFLPIECSGILVADPAAGTDPIERTTGNTELLTANAAQTSTQSLTRNTADKIHTQEFGPFDISSYYEGDFVALKINLESEGTPAQDLIIWTVEVSGVKWAHGSVMS